MKNQMYFSYIIDAIDEMRDIEDYNQVRGMIKMAKFAGLINMKEKNELIEIAFTKLCKIEE